MLGSNPCQASLGSQHHQLCHRDLQVLIQNHMAPPHGPPARVLSPPFLPAVSLLHSSKLLRESSASLLHLAFQLPKLHGKGSPKASWFFLSWLLHLDLNPSTSLPLQPHFQLLPQSATPTSILVFFQLFWAAIAILGRHSNSGQAWPHGMEPIISKLLCRLCNQGELPPSYILGRSHSHPPGSKHGHSYLTYP